MSDTNNRSTERVPDSEGGTRLGDILVELGFVERAVVEGAATVQQRGIEKRIGALLVQHGHISHWQLEQALQIQAGTLEKRPYVAMVGRVGVAGVEGAAKSQRSLLMPESHAVKALSADRLVSEGRSAREVARKQGLPFARLGRHLKAPDSFLSALLPMAIMSRLRAIPIEKDAGRLMAVLENPADKDCLHELEIAAGCPIDPIVSTPTEILYVLKNYAAQEARLAAEQAAERERLAATKATMDKAYEKIHQEAEKEFELARQVARQAELEEQLAAKQLVIERSEEEKDALQVRFVQEKALIDKKYANEHRVLERNLSEAKEALERNSQDKLRLEQLLAEARKALEWQRAYEKENLVKRLDEEMAAVERRVEERVNKEKAILQVHFSEQLKAADEKLLSERRLLEEKLAEEKALTAQALSEKAMLANQLREARASIVSLQEQAIRTEAAKNKPFLDRWQIGGIVTATVVVLTVIIYLLLMRGPSKVAQLQVPTPSTVKQPVVSKEVAKDGKVSMESRPSGFQDGDTGRPSAGTPAITEKAGPPTRKERVPEETETKSTMKKRLAPRAIHAITPQDLQNKGIQRTVSPTDEKTLLIKSLENRLMTGEIVLARLDVKINSLMKELESRKSVLAGSKPAVVAEHDSGARDSHAIDEYNGGVRSYNKLVAEIKQAAAEYDSIQQQNLHLAEKYRNIISRR